jgi:hypothetical protein
MSAPQNNPRVKTGLSADRPSPIGLPLGNLYVATDTGVISSVGPAGWVEQARTQKGTLTLILGSKLLNAGITITPSSKVYVSLNTPLPIGVAQGVKYAVPDFDLVEGGPGVGAFRVNAVDNLSNTVGTDVSTINYLIVG